MRNILKRTGLRILPILLFFVTRSRAFADMAWEPAPGSQSISPRSLIRTIFICIIGLVWLLAKFRMLKSYDGSGWYILIPFYGRYLEYKYYWDEKYYHINLLVSVFIFVLIALLTDFNIRIILMYVWLAVWVVITVLMRMKTMEAFGKKKLLGLLELLGLGFVLDCICALVCIRKEAERKQKEKQALLQEQINNWE